MAGQKIVLTWSKFWMEGFGWLGSGKETAYACAYVLVSNSLSAAYLIRRRGILRNDEIRKMFVESARRHFFSIALERNVLSLHNRINCENVRTSQFSPYDVDTSAWDKIVTIIGKRKDNTRQNFLTTLHDLPPCSYDTLAFLIPITFAKTHISLCCY